MMTETTSWGQPKITLHTNKDVQKFLYSMDKEFAVKEMRKFLKRFDKYTYYFAMYHGTIASAPIFTRGILPTSNSRRRSYQSQNGYVCLSMYPNCAKTFGEAAYPGEKIVVYEVNIPLRMLKADRDQLANIRYWSGVDVGTDLATSLIYGNGARVKGKVDANLICGRTEY